MNLIQKLIGWFDALMNAFCSAFAIIFGVLTMLVCVNVVLRYFGIASMPWLVEIIEYSMYGGTFLAAPWVLRKGEHVRVDLILTTLPYKLTIRLEQAIDALGFGVSMMMCLYSIALLIDAYEANFIEFKILAVPEWLLILPMPIGCAMLSVEFLLRFFRVRSGVEKMAVPELSEV